MKKSFSFLPYIRVVLAALCNLALSYLLFMICRFVFLWVNYSYYSELTGTELMTILKGGLVFDTSAIVYINALYILLMFFPLHYKEYKRYQQVTKGVFVFTNSIALIMNLMDTVYFQFTNRRTTASVFNEFSNENLLILHFPEENLINGGTFGFEGSILCSLLLVLGTVIIIRHYYKESGIKD